MVNCRYCNSNFKSKRSSSAHERQIHKDLYYQDRNQFQCKVCGKFFQLERGLQCHITRTHSVKSNLRYKCNICGHKFENLHGLSIHIKLSHFITPEDYYDKYLLKNSNICDCGLKKSFISIIKGYRTFCSNPKCDSRSSISRQKAKNTQVEKYGSIYTSTDEGRDKLRNSWKKDSVRNKRIKTCILRYGFSTSSLDPEVQEKRRETNRNKFGSDEYFSSENFKQFCLSKYGTNNPAKDLEIKQKIFRTIIKSDKHHYSKYSQKVFNYIIQYLNLSVEFCYFGKYEKQYRNGGDIYLFDFVYEIDGVPFLILDFHGLMFHPKDGNIPDNNPFSIDINQAIKRDESRRIFANSICNYFVIWEDEWSKNKFKILDQLSNIIECNKPASNG